MARISGSKNIKWNKAELENLYYEQGLGSNQIARLFNTSGSAVRIAMTKLNIKLRNSSEALSGNRHYAWKGGRSKTSTGYIEVYMPEHHRANKRKRVYEHILVWEATHSRKLRKGEIVHHLNGIKTDNRPENLIAMMDKAHIRWIPTLQKRIRKLESEVKRCSQQVFNFSEEVL